MIGPVQCRTCGAAAAERALDCDRCGASLARAIEFQFGNDPVDAVSLPSSHPTTPPPRPSWKMALPILALVSVGVAAVLLIEPDEEELVVVARSWRRSVSVERFTPTRQSGRCAELPKGASDVTQRQLASERMPGARDCEANDAVRSGVAPTQKASCAPRREAGSSPDAVCEYSIAKWSKVRQAALEGRLAHEAPRWPAVTLARAGCASLGCEREGPRDETYTVVFRGSRGQEYRCDFGERVWSNFAQGQRHVGRLRTAADVLDCGSLQRAP